MKEIQQQQKAPTEFVKKSEIKHEQNKVGQIRMIKGLTLYKMSMVTGKISKVEIEMVDTVDFKNPGASKKKVEYQRDHLYVQALNDKNAKRKFEKIAKQIITDVNNE